MSDNLPQQFLNTLEHAKRPLIVLPEHANIDDFTTAFSCVSLLAKLNKPVEIVTTGGSVPQALNFLTPPTKIRGDLPGINKLTLKLNARKAQVDELSYNTVDNELHIQIMPKSGSWTREDISIETSGYRFDLILAIGGADLASFGALYTSYADFFFATPIINIDHTSTNEHFGQLNLVDISAVACTEVCHDLLVKIDPSLLDEEVATYLLAGMIFKTRSFRSNHVTPKTLKTAGELIALGARRDEIIEQLYKTRTIETLRLWGRALARLKADRENRIVWTLLSRDDFTRAGADETALENIIDELIVSSPDARIAAVFYENNERGIEVILHAAPPHDALFLGAPFRASGTREEAHLKLREKTLVAAERKVMAHLKSSVRELA